jgi:hypothetical protein
MTNTIKMHHNLSLSLMFMFVQIFGQTSAQPQNVTENNVTVMGCLDRSISCSGHGVCDTNYTYCICDDHYASYLSTNTTQCNYEKKKRNVALTLGALPIINWIGSPFWYLENYRDGSFELILCVLSTILFLICCKTDTRGMPDSVAISHGIELIIFTISWIGLLCFYWIYPCVAISKPDYLDGNGILLY